METLLRVCSLNMSFDFPSLQVAAGTSFRRGNRLEECSDEFCPSEAWPPRVTQKLRFCECSEQPLTTCPAQAERKQVRGGEGEGGGGRGGKGGTPLPAGVLAPRSAHLRAHPCLARGSEPAAPARTHLYGAILVVRPDWPAAGEDTQARAAGRGRGPGRRASGAARRRPGDVRSSVPGLGRLRQVF